MINVWLAIPLMACITFCCRYAFLTRSIPITLDARTRRFLTFTAPAVLTAMWAPLVFLPTIQNGDIANPFLLAGVGTVVISLVAKHTLAVVVGGMGLFLGLKHFLG